MSRKLYNEKRHVMTLNRTDGSTFYKGHRSVTDYDLVALMFTVNKTYGLVVILYMQNGSNEHRKLKYYIIN